MADGGTAVEVLDTYIYVYPSQLIHTFILNT